MYDVTFLKSCEKGAPIQQNTSCRSWIVDPPLDLSPLWNCWAPLRSPAPPSSCQSSHSFKKHTQTQAMYNVYLKIVIDNQWFSASTIFVIHFFCLSRSEPTPELLSSSVSALDLEFWAPLSRRLLWNVEPLWVYSGIASPCRSESDLELWSPSSSESSLECWAKLWNYCSYPSLLWVCSECERTLALSGIRFPETYVSNSHF